MISSQELITKFIALIVVKNPKRARALYAQRQKQYDDILGKTPDRRIPYVCIQCGHTGLSMFHREFCSDDCRHTYLDEHMVCETCGRNLAELGIHFNKRTGHPTFCSDACREKYNWKVAREKGLIDQCPSCGKDFIVKITKSHGGYCEERSKFCSQACSRAYRRNTQQQK